jgi:monoamine oxidase
MSEQEALQLGLKDLSNLLGKSYEYLAMKCVKSKRVSWARDEFTYGGYASIPPGNSDARVELARPEGDVLWFAGEAAAFFTNTQTVHGALESGARAGIEVVHSLLNNIMKDT